MDVTAITERLRDHEERKEERRITQMRNAREKARALKATAAVVEAVDMTEDSSAVHGEKRKGNGEASYERPAKVARTGLSPDTDEAACQSATGEPAPAEPPVAWSSMAFTKPSPEMRGHTSYLTFATFYPASVRASLAAQELTVTALRSGRVGELTAEAAKADAARAGSEDTEYGAMDMAMGQMTEEEVSALAGAQ